MTKKMKKNIMLYIIYVIISVVFIFDVIIYFYDYSFLGYWLDKILGWLWLLTTILFIFIFWNKKGVKVYLIGLTSIIVLSILPMGIPFAGIVLYFLPIDEDNRIALNEDFRIEKTKKSALSYPRIYIYKKHGILEKTICGPNYIDIQEEILKNHAPEKKIEGAKLIKYSKDVIIINYRIEGMHKNIIHKFNDKYGVYDIPKHRLD